MKSPPILYYTVLCEVQSDRCIPVLFGGLRSEGIDYYTVSVAMCLRHSGRIEGSPYCIMHASHVRLLRVCVCITPHGIDTDGSTRLETRTKEFNSVASHSVWQTLLDSAKATTNLCRKSREVTHLSLSTADRLGKVFVSHVMPLLNH